MLAMEAGISRTSSQSRGSGPFPRGCGVGVRLWNPGHRCRRPAPYLDPYGSRFQIAWEGKAIARIPIHASLLRRMRCAVIAALALRIRTCCAGDHSSGKQDRIDGTIDRSIRKPAASRSQGTCADWTKSQLNPRAVNCLRFAVGRRSRFLRMQRKIAAAIHSENECEDLLFSSFSRAISQSWLCMPLQQRKADPLRGFPRLAQAKRKPCAGRINRSKTSL